MSYAVGTEVRVRTIGKVGRVVAAGRGGRYRVLVGGIEVACREQELEAPPAPSRSRKVRQPPTRVAAASPPVSRPSDADRSRLGSIDLHGATVQEAVAAVEARLDEAIRAGLEHFDVVHGLGTGKLRHAVHRLLRSIGVVRHFEVTAGNPGVTRVYL